MVVAAFAGKLIGVYVLLVIVLCVALYVVWRDRQLRKDVHLHGLLLSILGERYPAAVHGEELFQEAFARRRWEVGEDDFQGMLHWQVEIGLVRQTMSDVVSGDWYALTELGREALKKWQHAKA